MSAFLSEKRRPFAQSFGPRKALGDGAASLEHRQLSGARIPVAEREILHPRNEVVTVAGLNQVSVPASPWDATAAQSAAGRGRSSR
jgi:hypothetical protein